MKKENIRKLTEDTLENVTGGDVTSANIVRVTPHTPIMPKIAGGIVIADWQDGGSYE